ncbi:hypothetical protein GF351_02035 [Candidatus Woesearchaeota archaeon]|nr:hypothetical protein [Candidatus Woesearchaeota archaeon]
MHVGLESLCKEFADACSREDIQKVYDAEYARIMENATITSYVHIFAYRQARSILEQGDLQTLSPEVSDTPACRYKDRPAAEMVHAL